jgi:16S rRNA (adenine1518-N6/adenine1519-N6)-dimethyltransferase
MNIRPLKQFGQHFLTDNDIADRIVAAADIRQNEPVWEIGPGKGVLTGRIIRQTDRLTAFEIDHRLAKLLQDRFGAELKLINRDILALNWKELQEQENTDHEKKIKLVSNLPYQITSPVLYKIEEHAGQFSLVVLMLQKEVADRLTAVPGSKAYGVLTLKIRYAFEVEKLFEVPPEAFSPPPKVHSSVIRLRPRQDKPVLKSLDTYRKIIQTAFVRRRKTLRNNLCTLFSAEELAQLEKQSGIDFSRRGETIAEGEFVHLADCAFDLAGH